MAATPQRPKLLVIVGPTASGKSALAMKVARKYRGEIIAADSRTIYKGMDIGTAKPTAEHQRKIPHWGLDLVAPGQSFSAAEFKKYAQAAIKDIQNRGKLPILVGGTGLYIDGVLFDFSFIRTSNTRRLVYTNWSIEKLYKLIQQRNWPVPENWRNKRHLVRAVERRGKTGTKRTEPLEDSLLIGLMPAPDELKRRINKRAERIFSGGVIEETNHLVNQYGEKALTSTGGIVYKVCIRLIRGEIDRDQAKDLFKRADWQYARRQRTWFKRHKSISWFDSADTAYQEISTILNN